MKRVAMAVALACVLSVTALAGDVPSTDSPAPPPGDIHTTDPTSPGDVPTTDNASPGDMPGVDWSVVLTILDVVF